jgi:hypothetical protein
MKKIISKYRKENYYWDCDCPFGEPCVINSWWCIRCKNHVASFKKESSILCTRDEEVGVVAISRNERFSHLAHEKLNSKFLMLETTNSFITYKEM